MPQPARMFGMPVFAGLLCLSAACSSAGAPGSAVSFDITVTGGAAASIRGSDGRLVFDDSTPGYESYAFRFVDRERERVVLLVFYGTTPPEAGTYSVGGEMGEDPSGVVLASYAVRPESATYGQQPSGSVTLSVAGGLYSGELVFEARGGPPTDRDRTVKVEGSFSGISLPDAS